LRPAYLEIDLGAIAHNVRTIRRIVGPQVRVLAIVKANAYGHGAVEVSKASLEAGASLLCVAIPQEAVELREAGITAPVLVLGPPDTQEAPVYLEHDIISTVSDVSHIEILAEAARHADGSARVHLKLDSGMGRHGVRSPMLERALDLLAAEPHIRVEGLFSHFADACADDLSWSRHQLEAFREMAPLALSRLPGAGPMVHMSNSAGIVRLPEANFDAVRPGAILYGLNPGFDPELMPDLRPALALKGSLATVKSVEAGAPVGYNCAWRAERDSRIGIVPLGYVDGYPRTLSNNADVLVGGRRCPLVGLVSMDAITVDLTDAPGAKVGDEVVLIGRQGDEQVTVEELSTRAGTIVEEIAGRLSSRLPRRYLSSDGGGCR